MSIFKSEYTYMERCEESSKMIGRYPDKIPVICEINPSADIELKFTRLKYLVPRDLTVGQLVYVIRKRFELPPEKAIFIMVDNKVVPPTTALVSDIYSKHRDSDGFLYTGIYFESFFGA
jgi:GABA(A) receptor-associated protein